jgi:uncharacterized protein (TIGR02466 family)
MKLEVSSPTSSCGSLALDPSLFEVRSLFPTPVVYAPLAEPDALNAGLRQVVVDRAATDPGVSRSNAGGWQSSDDFADWSGEPGRLLLDLARRLGDAVTGVMQDGQLQLGGPAWKVNAWANVNRASHANRVHHHPGAYWSGVYWVSLDADDQGGLFEAHDPRGVLPSLYAPQLRYALPGCLSAGGTDYITPKPGVMVLFPAWLQHAVLPHTSGEPRISVAFNLCV